MCTETSVLIDSVTEAPKVSGDDRSVMGALGAPGPTADMWKISRINAASDQG